MNRRLPIVPTVLVLAAAAIMVALGVWQLQRAEWKSGMIARYEQAIAMSSEVRWPDRSADYQDALFRRTTLTCAQVQRIEGRAGRALTGAPGWMQVAHCELEGGGMADVALGWSRAPQPPVWRGGEVRGQIVPAGEGIRLIAMPAVAGLADLAIPDPQELPNNHLSYAVQWFLFALTALIIYGLALRGRWKRHD